MATYTTYRITIRPLTAFGTPLVGDTLFGQLCWALRYRLGNDALESLLDGYTDGRPFAVLSDAFPAGYLPLPIVPSAVWQNDGTTDIKILKKRRWIPVSALQSPISSWQSQAVNDADAKLANTQTMQPHNTINRETGTTGTGMFAPYTMPQTWYAEGTAFDCYAVVDESRLSAEDLKAALVAIGATGYGRDATVGLGKFELADMVACQWQASSGITCMALASCAPQGMDWNPAKSWYQLTTRFGRHGDVAATGKNPFKRPVILAKAGAVFTLGKAQDTPFIGQGIGGVSFADAKTVHQGYAPALYLPAIEGDAA